MKVIGAGCMGEVALHEDHTRAWYSFLIEGAGTVKAGLSFIFGIA